MTSAARLLCAPIAGWLLLACSTWAADKHRPLYQLHGQVLDSDGKLIRNPEPQVFLHGGTLPYNNHTRVGLDGTFKFKKLLPGSYVLIIAVPGQGEMRETVEIGPTLADKKRVVHEVVKFKPASSTNRAEIVQKSQLTIPKEAQEKLRRSLQALGRNDVAAARKLVLQALDLAPHYAGAWNELGVIAYQTGDFPAAEHHFRRALEEDPEAYWALVNLGGALLAVGKDAEALAVNEKAVKRIPEDALAQSQLGKSYLRLQNLEKAEAHLRKAKTLDPRHFSSPQLALADLYFIQGRYDERVRELEEYLKYHPDGPFAERVRKLLQDARRQEGAR